MTRVAAAAMCVWMTACSGGDSSSAASNGPAGTVRAVTGDVTAQRGDAEARALAVDAEVFRDDTITTADDASVTIVLAHNAAAWTLGGGESRRIDETAAWRAPKGAQELEVVEGADRTAAAGRHAERSATDRPAFAAKSEAVKDDEAPAAEAEPPPPAPAAAMPPPAEPTPDPSEVRRKRSPKRGPKHDTRKPKGGSGSSNDPFGDPGDPLGGNRKAPDAKADDTPPATLTPAQIKAGIATVRARVGKCATADGPTTVTIAFTISASGTVTSATVKGDDTAAARCVAAAVQSAVFPAAGKSTSVTMPFRL